MADQNYQPTEEEKEYNVRLFFATIQMLAINEYDISAYESLLSEFESEEEYEKRGEDTRFISFEELSEYINDINFYNYGASLKFPKGRGISFLITNNKTKKIKYICYYENGKKDISAEDVQIITDNCMNLWKEINKKDEGIDFFGINSNYECLIISDSKVGSYSKERIRGIKHFRVIEEEIVLIKPFNHVFQSTIEKMPVSEFNEKYGDIPKSNLPSITSSDSYMSYREISKVPTKIHRETINEIELIKNTVYVKIVN